MASPNGSRRAAPAPAPSTAAQPIETCRRRTPGDSAFSGSWDPGAHGADGRPSESVEPEKGVSPEEDQEAADAQRACHRDGTRVPIEPDRIIGPLLSPGELVLAARPNAVLERRHPHPGGHVRGALYVTSRRLVHVSDQGVVSCDLERIREAIVAGGRLLILLSDGDSLAMVVDRPRLLRVEMAGSRAARRDCATRVRSATVR